MFGLRVSHAALRFVLLFAALAASQTTFINPPPAGPAFDFTANQVFEPGSLVALRWTTNLPSYDIYLWQQAPDPAVNMAFRGPSPIFSKIGGSETGFFAWTATSQTLPLNRSEVFFLSLGPLGSVDLSQATMSHYFTLQGEPCTSGVLCESRTGNVTA